MRDSLEFFLGLLEHDGPAVVTREDFDGAHGEALRAWQAAGVIGRDAAACPVPSCPHCAEGVPYRLGERHLCHRCRSTIDPAHLLAWGVDREAFLGWLAGRLGLRGGLRRIDAALWQMGTWAENGELLECFFVSRSTVSAFGESRLRAYRGVLLLYGLLRPPEADRLPCRSLSLVEVLRPEGPPAVNDLTTLLRSRGNVRFEEHSGCLWVGEGWLGEVPLGSKEHAFLRCLAQSLDHFVPYPDLKREVLRLTGSADATEEATFCQKLKSRIKKHSIPTIDLLVATSNKATGYRLRGRAELSRSD